MFHTYTSNCVPLPPFSYNTLLGELIGGLRLIQFEMTMSIGVTLKKTILTFTNTADNTTKKWQIDAGRYSMTDLCPILSNAFQMFPGVVATFVWNEKTQKIDATFNYSTDTPEYNVYLDYEQSPYDFIDGCGWPHGTSKWAYTPSGHPFDSSQVVLGLTLNQQYQVSFEMGTGRDKYDQVYICSNALSRFSKSVNGYRSNVIETVSTFNLDDGDALRNEWANRTFSQLKGPEDFNEIDFYLTDATGRILDSKFAIHFETLID